MTDLSIRPEQKPKPYMTVIPSRHPRQKLHANLGQAKNAATWNSYHTNGRYDKNTGRWVSDGPFVGRTSAIYEWNSETEDWVLLYELQRGDEVPWRKK